MPERYRLRGIIELYKRPNYIALNIVMLLVYYFVITSIIRYQNRGILLLNIPIWTLYLLVISSSMLTTISVFSFINARKASQSFGTPIGALTVLVGGVLEGCGCSTPLIFGLASFGISTSSLIYSVDLLSSLSKYIFLGIILINIAFIAYYIRGIDNYYCKKMVGSSGRERSRE
ncbi:MAG: hypothetical protein M1562_02350 [Candidatus Marsarchaeota archaeon]|nr:hypothetical protein [Candidatus Marsarchaeota archaeon]